MTDDEVWPLYGLEIAKGANCNGANRDEWDGLCKNKYNFAFLSGMEAMDLRDIVTLSCIVILRLHVITVGILEYENVYRKYWGVQESEWCVLGMCEDVIVGMKYVILSFPVALWLIIPKFILAISCIAWIHYVFVEGGGGRMESDIIQATNFGADECS